MVRSGFTFIELIIVIAIISTMSVIALNTFDSTRSRILFFNDVSRIEDSLKLARSTALSDKSLGLNSLEINTDSLRSGVVVRLNYDQESQNYTSIRAYKVDELNLTNEKGYILNEENRIVDVDFSDNDNLLLSEVLTYRVSGNQFLQSKVIKNDFLITFDKEGRCSFLEDSEEGLTTITDVIFNIPLVFTETDQALRYLYMHSTACIPEIIIIDFFNPDNLET